MIMWLFYFTDSEHKKLSKKREKLEAYIRKLYDYANWKFNWIDDKTYQIVEIDKKTGGIVNYAGFIIEVEVI